MSKVQFKPARMLQKPRSKNVIKQNTSSWLKLTYKAMSGRMPSW